MNKNIILLVESNPDDEYLIKKAFNDIRIFNEVFVVKDSEEALNYLFMEGAYSSRESQKVGIILLDLSFSRSNEFGIIKSIREDKRTQMIPIVVLISSSEDEKNYSNSYIGVNSVLRKPEDFDQLTKTVQQLGLYWLHVNENPFS